MVLGAVVLLAAVVWGIGRWRYASTHVSTDNAQVDGHIVPVLAKVGGYVREVRVEDNQPVSRGDTLVVIDDAELRVKLAEAEADASATQARRQALEARLASARTQRDRIAKDLARVRDLAEKQIASRQQLDAAEAAATASESDVAAVEREVMAARPAALERARLDLSYVDIGAPVAGVMSRTQAEVGQLVQPGQPLGAVVADSSVWITANLKETETDEVRQGQAVALEVDAYPGCEARGVVESLSAATGAKFALLPPDNATGNFTKVVQRVPVRIAVTQGCGADRPLRPGMSVVAHIAVR